MANDTVVRKGLGLSSWLTLIFVVAKLLGVINWSWWLVFAPTLISTFLTVTILIICLIFAFICR